MWGTLFDQMLNRPAMTIALNRAAKLLSPERIREGIAEVDPEYAPEDETS